MVNNSKPVSGCRYHRLEGVVHTTSLAGGFDFSSAEELKEFVNRNYPDISQLELVNPVELHDMMWKAIDKIKRTDSKTLPID